MSDVDPDWILECSNCGNRRGPEGLPTVCDLCGLPWLVRYPDRVPTLIERAELRRRHGMWRFRPFLPLLPGEEPITLGEGDTPLLRAPRTGARLGPGSTFGSRTRARIRRARSRREA